jgi:hypothetical protein
METLEGMDRSVSSGKRQQDKNRIEEVQKKKAVEDGRGLKLGVCRTRW